MLGHNFENMPGRLEETILRCTWCKKPPTKAREDGCPIHELEENGKILLSVFNPEGIPHFHGRFCLTCNGPIMGHYLRRNSPHYWCSEDKLKYSEGINDCVWEVDGVAAPREATEPRQPLQ